MRKILRKKKIFIALGLAICIVVSLSAITLAAQTENVVIHKDTDPELTKVAIGDGLPWQATTTFSQDKMSESGRRLYDIQSDAYVLWWDHDDFDYFYKPYYFGYGRKAKLTVETTVNSWDLVQPNASAGIVLRSSTDKSAATAFLHVRDRGGITFIYRANDKAENYGSAYFTNSTKTWPIRLKMEVQNNKVKNYYALGGSNNWTEVPGSYSFNYKDNIMVGLGTHSSEQIQARAVFEGLSITIEAPEGMEYKEYGGSSGEGTGDDKEDDPTVTLPDDFPITEDVLFMETFTDGSMTAGEEGVSNPIWESSNPKMNENIQLDEVNRNRYLFLDAEDYYYFAGNQKMSDYSLDMDVNFSKESMPNEINQFRVYVRHRYSPMTGHYYYYVDFIWNADKQTGSVSIGKGYHNSNPVKGTYPTKKEISNGNGGYAVYSFDYLSTEKLGNDHKLQIDVMDNQITVLWDGTQIAYGIDEDTSKFFNGFGGIGLYSDKATVSIDNICVRKLEDYYGGDYDNQIGGRFDEKIPDYIETYQENGWVH